MYKALTEQENSLFLFPPCTIEYSFVPCNYLFTFIGISRLLLLLLLVDIISLI